MFEQDAMVRLQLGKKLEQVLMDKEEVRVRNYIFRQTIHVKSFKAQEQLETLKVKFRNISVVIKSFRFVQEQLESLKMNLARLNL